MNIDFTGKTAIVTGGSRGIGAACVKLLDQSGANVAFTYNSNNRAAESVAKGLKNEHFFSKVDLSEESEIKHFVKSTYEKFGRIDILINNAGIWTFGKSDEMSTKTWEELIKINLTGSFLFAKFVIPLMKEQNYGRIINVTSTAGVRGEAYHSHYAASKGGMNAYTKSLAVELAPFGITVNSVAPGWVDTDMNNEVFKDKELVDKILNDIPTKRIASPEDVAYPILFVASDLARHINGEIMNVNGGAVLCG
jgi:3-oxoacyl-[acyl-carrier protein] reductase